MNAKIETSATTSPYLTVTQLNAAMQGVPSTNLWDVVCSYTVDKLNDFLAAQYDAGQLATEVKLSTQRADPLTGESFTIKYDIFFGTPKMSFVAGRSGYAQLDMPIEDGSSYSVWPQGATEPSSTTEIPGGTYSVVAVVPLAAVDGTTGEVAPDDSAVTFSDGDTTDSHVVIHFKTEKGTTYNIVPAPDSSQTDPLETYFLPVLAQYFQDDVDEVDYAVASVNNHKPTEGDTVLTPKSFVFSSWASETSGVLSLYIQTEESGNPQGNLAPSFQPGDTQIPPVPAGYDASIILSNSLVKKGYLAPQLSACGFSTAFPAATNGISVTLTSSAKVVVPSDDDNYIFGNDSYSGLDFSLDDFPMTLNLIGGNASVSWKAKKSCGWSESNAASGTPSYGTVDLTITVNKGPIALKPSSSDFSIADIELTTDDYDISTKAESCAWYETMAGCIETVPNYYENEMKLKVPGMSISLNGLDFFATTNLLTPGEQVVVIDDDQGVHTPYDFLIVGQVSSQ